MLRESEVEYMKPKIVKANSLKETSTPERCFIAENYSDEDISVAQARVKPGITTLSHHLVGVNEIYLITSGKGQVDVGDLKPTKVAKGDLIVIPSRRSPENKQHWKNRLGFLLHLHPKIHGGMLPRRRSNKRKPQWS